MNDDKQDIYEKMREKDAQIADLRSKLEAMQWVSCADRLPETHPNSYMCEMSDKVLVCGEGKNQYPWVAHLHADKSKNYREYAHSFDVDGVSYTWLNPYRDHVEGQCVTRWMPLPPVPDKPEV